jgi:hypothetical protein
MPAPLPAARVVKQAGQLVAPPPVPLQVRFSPVLKPMRAFVGALLAVWPLTAVMLMAIAMVWAAGFAGSP